MSAERTPRQVSLARLVEFGVVPKRSLGQNFLVDDNIIGVILQRLAPLPADVAIEVGAGLGILTRALAEVVARVHAFEIDRSLAPALEATLSDTEVAERVLLQYRDIMKVPLESLEPLPTICASNLPYSVAAPFLGEALERLPSVRRYCVMMQKEVAHRLAASSGGKDYGSLSVWVQLHARIVEVRALSRTIFHPQPNVDSSLVTLDRSPIDPLVTERPTLMRAVVEGAFSQRRKLAVNALSASLGVPKEALGDVFRLAGVPTQARAEAVEPHGFVALARGLMEFGLDDRYNETPGRSGRAGSG
ncbi:MAG: ribosomal RNA small subunit methyltransferase A [Actinobacteria bacterium]|nr:ribosomal RNA small subunit methyltransferase A [Actinomycetota bacterium]